MPVSRWDVRCVGWRVILNKKCGEAVLFSEDAEFHDLMPRDAEQQFDQIANMGTSEADFFGYVRFWDFRLSMIRVPGMTLLHQVKTLLDIEGKPRLSPRSVEDLLASTRLSREQLMLELIPLASTYAQPSLSGFHVGAVGLGISGALYFGANFEFPGCEINQTIHAEQATVINALAHRETGLTALAVSAPPCGYCRQFLHELRTADELKILLADEAPSALAEFLPGAFGPQNLGVVGGLMTPQQHKLMWSVPADPPPLAAELTREAAKASYAPYTKAYSGVGFTVRDGETFVGSYLENAAFNPSISPVLVAAAQLLLAGRRLEEVSYAVSVQREDSPIDHTAAARSFLGQLAPYITLEEFLVLPEPMAHPSGGAPLAKKKPQPLEAQSFYFFDFDDNIMFLPTPILLRHTSTKRLKKVKKAEFSKLRVMLGQPGRWKEFETFEDTYSHFQDIPPEKLKAAQKQHFVEDIEKAIKAKDTSWQAPSWPLFVYACENVRPMAIITSRGHTRETLMTGMRVLVERKWIPREPNLLVVYPVRNPTVVDELIATLDDPLEQKRIRKRKCPISDLKRIAIHSAVEQALEVYGHEPEHRFGMPDDDPENVDLIIKAMCDCKIKHIEKRFFVINTHHGQWVKLEVFPPDFPVTDHPSADQWIV